MTLLDCTNADETDRLPPLFIGRAKDPRCFRGVFPGELRFGSKFSTKAWMTTEIFQRWVQRLDLQIGRTHERKVLLSIDNAACNNIEEISISLRNMRVEFLQRTPHLYCSHLTWVLLRVQKTVPISTYGTCGRCYRRLCDAKPLSLRFETSSYLDLSNLAIITQLNNLQLLGKIRTYRGTVLTTTLFHY